MTKLKVFGKCGLVEGSYFVDYSPRDILVNEIINGLMVSEVYDQFLNSLGGIPQGWQTIVKFEGDLPNEMIDLPEIGAWGENDTDYDLWVKM